MFSTKRVFWPIILALAILIGLALRLINISDPHIVDFHAWRQGDTAGFSHGYLTESLNLFDPSTDRYPCQHRGTPFGRVEAELPFASWLAALPLAAMGINYPPPWHLRSVSVLFFLGICAYLFLLTSRISKSRSVGATTVLIFSVLPLSAFFTRTVQPDGPALFFTCGFLYHLLCWLENDKPAHGVASAIFAALTFLQKISNAFVFFPAMYLIIERHGIKGSVRNWRFWVWGISIMVPVVAWYRAASRNPWSFGIWSDKYSKLNQLVDISIWQTFSDRLMFDILTWAGLVLIVLGMTQMRRSRAVRFAAVWLSSVVLFIAIAIPANRTHVYYQLPLVLPASIVIAVATVELAKRSWTHRALLVFAAIIHVFILQGALKRYHSPSADFEDGIGVLERNVPANSVIVSTDRNPALFYNARVKGWFAETSDLNVLVSCMGSDASYLLIKKDHQTKLDASPNAKQLLEQFEKVESSRLFTLWKKKGS